MRLLPGNHYRKIFIYGTDTFPVKSFFMKALISSVFFLFLVSCKSAANITSNDNDNYKAPAKIIRSQSEIDMMIHELTGKTKDEWKKSLPEYFGVDSRNKQTLIIVGYCSESKCDSSNFNLLLIYKSVRLNYCRQLHALPLFDHVNGKYIGCEPSINSDD